MPAEDLAVGGHILTWIVTNATALGVVYKWLTRPIDEKIASLREALKELGDRVKALEDVNSPRASISDAPTLAEVTRRLEEVEEWRKEIERFRSQVVTDDEFKGYTMLASAKIESILKGLAWIKGRLSDREDEG